MRRFARLTNGFFKKTENRIAAAALYFMYYHFCRVHQTIRVTPAMEVGLTDRCNQLGNSSNSGKSTKRQRRIGLTAKGRSNTISSQERIHAASKAVLSASGKGRRNIHLARKGGQALTQKAQKNFRLLSASTARYSGTVQEMLSKRNRKPNSAVVASAAKYYPALKKLADG